jgi:multidrug efflux pump subunit AcrB
LRHAHPERSEGTAAKPSLFDRFRAGYERLLAPLIKFRWVIAPVYLLVCLVIVWLVGGRLGQEIFPVVDTGAFRLRLRAADGTHIAKSEQIAKQALDIVASEVGKENVELSLGYVGMIHSNFPVNAVYQWSRGPEEAILYVDLTDKAHIDVEQLKETLRSKFAKELPAGTRFSFEPADIINDVMSFGSPTPVEISVSGASFADSRQYAQRVHNELATLPFIKDLQFGQSLDYPTVEVNVDREKAGLVGLTPSDVSKSLVAATSSSRFTVPNYWADPKSGIAYQVQVEIPRPVVRSVDGVQMIQSADDIGQIPLKHNGLSQVLVRDIAEIRSGTMPGQFDRYNMKRQITLTANRTGTDLGTLSREVSAAIKRALPELYDKHHPDHEKIKGYKVEIRGQIPPMNEMSSGLSVGLLISIAAVFLLLTANFQSLRLALVAVSSVPAVVAGTVLLLWITGTTLNIQSFIGAIMAIGVAMANAILLVTFAETRRREGDHKSTAAVHGAGGRLRAILMTTFAMIAGMLPMALAFGESGAQNAPLGRAVIGGLAAGTVATLFILPVMFAILGRGPSFKSASLDPDDPDSNHYAPPAAAEGA